ncbi:MAG: phage major capsid protein, partial [Flavobacteriales bacterium]
TQHPDAIAGLDHLVSLTPESGVVGGLDRATEEWWRNHAATGVATTELVNTMEGLWRDCTLNGGRPNFIIAGSAFVDEFRLAAKDEISRYTILKTSGQNAQLDPSIEAQATSTGLHFQQVPIVWDPTFDAIAAETGDDSWLGRCYMLNTNHIRLRPAAGHDMIARKPNRQYDYYIWYWGLTFKGSLTMNRANCHAVITTA